MHIRDLANLGQNNPSPYGFPLPLKRSGRWGYGLLPDGMYLLAVGWLGKEVPTTGVLPSECIEGLWEAFEARLVVHDGTAGWHNCELCEGEDEWYPDGKVGPVVEWRGERHRVRGYGHFLVRWEDRVYIAPVLILHYILDHDYRPPEIFCTAVMEGRFLGPDDLDWVGEEPISSSG